MLPVLLFLFAPSPPFHANHSIVSSGLTSLLGKRRERVSGKLFRILICTTDKGLDITLDNDDPEHITWLYQKALQRAQEFNIPGVTYSMTQGVVKNIIPAIASTNAIIAASCCNEAFKIASNSNPPIGMPGANNYMMYSGDEGLYTYTFEHQKKDDCPVCGNLAKEIVVKSEWSLQEFIEHLAERPEA